MLDCDVSHLIDGVNIDRPFNAMSLTPNYHDAFGSFKVYFTLFLVMSIPTRLSRFSILQS